MSNLGRCPDCANNKPVILIGGKCPYHFQRSGSTDKVLPTKEKKPKKIAHVSKKQAVNLKEYSALRKEFLAANQVCQASLTGCTVKATEVHHKAKRGKNLNKVETWLATCRNCHTWIELHPLESIELGFSHSQHKKQ